LKWRDERLQGYLPALKKFNESLLGKKLSHIDEFLELILPELRTAFRSDIAFLADGKGKIFHVEPAVDEKSLMYKMLTGTERFDKLIEKGDPLIADKIDGENRELKALNVDSLMIIRMETPGGFRIVGAANGKKCRAINSINRLKDLDSMTHHNKPDKCQSKGK